MNKLFLFLAFLSVSILASAQTGRADSTQAFQLVEAACGQCQFKLPGKGCSLAVRIEGKAYFVDGSSIDEHGDAHADDGFCNAIRKARVQGSVVEGRFHSSYFALLPVKKKK
jgi:hypothetical protein